MTPGAAMRGWVELIQPHEKISPLLRGTGYLPPSKRATRAQIIERLHHDAKEGIGLTVWKVAQDSVKWRAWAKSRRLTLWGASIPCAVVGSVRGWWFVSIDIELALKRLEPTR